MHITDFLPDTKPARKIGPARAAKMGAKQIREAIYRGAGPGDARNPYDAFSHAGIEAILRGSHVMEDPILERWIVDSYFAHLDELDAIAAARKEAR